MTDVNFLRRGFVPRSFLIIFSCLEQFRIPEVKAELLKRRPALTEAEIAFQIEKVRSEYYSMPSNTVVTGCFGDTEPSDDSGPYGGKFVLGKPVSIAFEGKKGDIMVMASDGLWDVMSEYEVQQMAKAYPNDPATLQEKIYEKVYSRNNSAGVEYEIVHQPGIKVKKVSKSGDNITIAVLQLSGPQWV